MAAKYPAMKSYRGFNGAQPKGALLHNDDSHGFPDLNGGGGPSGVRNKPTVSSRDRTGAGTRTNGRDPAPSASLSGRGSSGMPSAPYRSEGRDSSTAETRVPGHGGSPQHREREIPGDFHKRGGIGAHGQEFVPGGRKSDVSRAGGAAMTSGNTGGRAYRFIAGRFKRSAMGARSTGEESKGRYGSTPVTANT